MLRTASTATKVLKRYQTASNYLPLLLKATEGDVSAAKNELRWLQEHVNQLHPTRNEQAKKLELWKLCERREKLEPLQYILGTQPFGELEIKCAKGVLIPRPETEAYTIHLARLLNSETFSEILKKQFVSSLENSNTGVQSVSCSSDASQERNPDTIIREPQISNEFITPTRNDSHENDSENFPLKAKSHSNNSNASSLDILDICSGSGCISLLLHSLLSKKFHNLKIRGWDISRTACKLANESLRHNIANGTLSPKAGDQVVFHQRANMFNPRPAISKQLDDVDIIISNPPYISTEKLLTEATQSVREWEPHRALVPPVEQKLDLDQYWPGQGGHIQPEDIFYARLLYLYGRGQRCKALVMEIGDQEQAIRVVEMALKVGAIAENNRIEIWQDFPDQESELADNTTVMVEKQTIPVIGSGSMRTVVLKFQSVGQNSRKRNGIPSRTVDESKEIVIARDHKITK